MNALRGALCAFSVIAIPTSAQAQAFSVPTAKEVASMCPDIGSTGLRLGLTRDEQAAAVADVQTRRHAVQPFTDAELDFTPWSGVLAAVTWRGAAKEGVELDSWRDAAIRALTDDGWIQTSELGEADHRPSGAPVEFERQFGPRNYAVQLQADGAFMLTCGDKGLIALKKAEADGELADGAARPQPPAPVQPIEAYVARLDCTDPRVVAAFAKHSRIDDAITELGPFTGPAPLFESESEYQHRLTTWLSWTMRKSGKISQDELWAVEDKAALHDGSALTEDFMRFLVQADGIIKGQQAKDGKAQCHNFRALLQGEDKMSRKRAERAGRINAALEAEARKRGIAVD